MTELLTDPGHIHQDLKQIESAIRRREFAITDAVYKTLANHMAAIVMKGSERNKIAAARVIVAMSEFNRRQEPQQIPQTTINVGVNVDNRTDAGRDPLMALGERIKAARALRQPH